jgi:hypothetical protein
VKAKVQSPVPRKKIFSILKVGRIDMWRKDCTGKLLLQHHLKHKMPKPHTYEEAVKNTKAHPFNENISMKMEIS